METQPTFEGFSYKFVSKVNPEKKFELKPLRKEDVEDATLQLVACFGKGDPMTVYNERTFENLYDWLNPRVHRAAEDNLGVVCTDQDTGKIAFLLTAHDYYNLIQKPIVFGPKMQKNQNVTELFMTLCADDSLKPEKFGDVIQMCTLSCSDDYQGLGLGYDITAWVVKNHPLISKAKAIKVTTTHPASKRIFEKLGWEVKNTLNVVEFKTKAGETPFADYADVIERKQGLKDCKEVFYFVYENRGEAKM
mmetsp:Transcript_55217/g.63449  ORF Transcript_55217/g.63449 Transcript_55217/m.63449 type:complete len:249 (+) Transcript_55217:52-798(+)|eukprot:CAMPEP_0176406292 /NCGR_PEP_ID=MMETSP0127-20121128/793_1 /TAXON_ID=938130 /ORGANISM="Platyophrya macrostoma, Strain WH" /LENGTH=248 /DNA_ID=CAMNT_0017785407 /DNA_START=52 /DNA_END=798 /DNA_ORIENTATION=+